MLFVKAGVVAIAVVVVAAVFCRRLRALVRTYLFSQSITFPPLSFGLHSIQ